MSGDKQMFSELFVVLVVLLGCVVSMLFSRRFGFLDWRRDLFLWMVPLFLLGLGSAFFVSGFLRGVVG